MRSLAARLLAVLGCALIELADRLTRRPAPVVEKPEPDTWINNPAARAVYAKEMERVFAKPNWLAEMAMRGPGESPSTIVRVTPTEVEQYGRVPKAASRHPIDLVGSRRHAEDA